MFYKLSGMYRHVKWIALISVITLAGLGALYDRFVDTPGGVPQTVAAKAAPDFSFTDLGGKSHRLKDFRGRVAIINFWATWCMPCVVEFPPMLEFAANNDVVLIALSSDDEEAAIENFLDRLPKTTRAHLQQANVLIGLDEGRKIARDLYGTRMYPETYMIAPDGHLARKIAGVVEWDDPLLKKYVETLSPRTSRRD
jgi:thiol-disulfide isomerase/thioredoxin